MAVGRLDKTAKIETKRFMEVLNMLRAGLTFAEMTEIASILCAFDESTNKIIYFYEFMKPIKLLLAPPEPEDEKEPPSPPSPEPEAFDIVLEKEPRESKGQMKEDNKEDELVREEVKKSLGDERVELKEKIQVEPEIPMSEINEAWCDGEFSIVINRCHDCHQHRDYTRHYEEVRMGCNSDRSI
jgi:hypothetical protein